MNGAHGSARWVGYVAAAALYAVATLWFNRAVLDHPATVVNFNSLVQSNLGSEMAGSDLTRGVTQLAYAARSLSTRPLDFFDGGMCYPSADSVTFGEHMLGEGVQGLPAYLVSGDPVVTYNFVVALKPWIAAMAMYALAFHWTGNTAAALIAGLLFGFHPMRLTDLYHPSVRANEWIPLVLLSLDLLFTRRRWRYAAMLAAVGSLQCLESMYVLIQYALIVGVYGLYLCARHWRALPRILPRLLVATLPIAGTAWAVLTPYLQAREMWGILEGRTSWAFPTQLALGSGLYPGNCLLGLAALGLLDRFLGTPRHRDGDPRLAMVLVVFAVAWFVLPLPLSWIDVRVPSLRHLAQPWIPGLGAIRAPNNVFTGVATPLALLAAYGVRAVANAIADSGRGAPWRRASVFAIVALLCAVEVIVPAWAEWTFGQPMPSLAYPMRPHEADLAAVRDLPPGAVLDMPVNYHFLWIRNLSRYVLLGAYHGRRVNSCKSSFITPVQHAVSKMSRRLPDRDAMRELWALGFRTVIFHVQDKPAERQRADAILEGLAGGDGPRLESIATGETVRVARLIHEEPVTTDVRTLSTASRGRLPLGPKNKQLSFGVRAGAVTFRHPDPIRMSAFQLCWRRGPRPLYVESTSGLLPLALAAGRQTDITVPSAVLGRVNGRFKVTLGFAGDPGSLVGFEEIFTEALPDAIPPTPRR